MIRNFSIKYALPALIALACLVIVGSNYYADTVRHRENILNTQQQLASHLGNQLVMLMEGQLLRGNRDEAEYILQSTVTHPSLNWAGLSNAEGLILLSSDYRFKNKQLVELATADQLKLARQSLRLKTSTMLFSDKTDSLNAFFPIKLQDNTQGGSQDALLILVFDHSAVLLQQRQLVNTDLWGLILLGLALTIAAGLYAHRLVIEPIQQLKQQVQSWRENLNTPAKVLDGPIELRQLSKSFSEITHEITEQHRLLQIFFDRQLQMALLFSPDGKIFQANQIAQRFSGLNEQQISERRAWDGPWMGINPDPETVAAIKSDFELIGKTGQTVSREIQVQNSNKDLRSVRYLLTAIQDNSDQLEWIMCEMEDTTELRREEQQKQRLLNFYNTLTELHSAMARELNAEQLYNDICQIIISHGDFAAAYIGIIDPDSLVVNPVAGDGLPSDILQRVTPSIDPSAPEGAGPIGTALREGRAFICDEISKEDQLPPPYRDALLEIDITSMAMFPLFEGDTVFGGIALYSRESHSFDSELVKLLSTLADDISFARSNLLRQQELTLSAEVIDNAHDALVILDANWKILSANQAYFKATGHSREEALGQHFLSIGEICNVDFIESSLLAALKTTGFWQGESEIRRKAGDFFPALVRFSASRDKQGNLKHIIFSATDISATRQAESQLEFLSFYDPLTELPNRQLFKQQFDHALSSPGRQIHPPALVVLDIDHFKNINDSLGHKVGDEIIKNTAQRLSDLLQAEDVLARFGGDEFVFSLAGRNPGQLAQLAQQLLWSFDEPFDIADHNITLRASIGIAIALRDGHNFEELYKHADSAMYNAKQLGRNRYCFFTEALNTSANERLKVESALRQAIDRDQLSLFYQAKVDAKTSTLVGFEALLRWQHPELGFVSPEKFIPIAEESDLIESLGTWVLLEACRQNRNWLDAGQVSLPISVNVSVHQINQKLIYTIQQALNKYRLTVDCLEIEITESVLSHHAEQTLDILNQISQLGIQISVDDFGTGYSNLSYLKRFPLDRLKIDRSFIMDLETDAEDRAIANAVINLGHSLNLAVIAEGVENQAQLELLREMGCDEIQGYFYSKPLPAADVFPHLQANKLLA